MATNVPDDLAVREWPVFLKLSEDRPSPGLIEDTHGQALIQCSGESLHTQLTQLGNGFEGVLLLGQALPLHLTLRFTHCFIL